MSFEIEGKIIVKDETIVVSEKFKKREFVIEHEDSAGGNVWVSTIKFQTVQAKCDLLDSFNIGDTVNVSFNVKGNKWEKDGKTSYFNNLDAWKVTRVGEATPENTKVEPAKDDLPF